VIATATGSTTQGYTTALISKIGAGSEAAHQIIPVWGDEDTIRAISHAPGYYLDHVWVTFLEQGDLARLTEKNLTHLIGDAKGDLVHARSVREQLKVLGIQIAAQTVPAALTNGLSNGSRQFVNDWNGYLCDAAKTVTGLREVTGRLLVFIADFGTLAKRAKVVNAGGSPAPYTTSLRRVQLDLRRISHLQVLAVKPFTYSKHMTAIMNLTKSNLDAHEIFQRVAAQYPSGVILPNGYVFTPHAIIT